MLPERREKIAALLHSPVAGERAAAQAALERVAETKPVVGSKEWDDARKEWWAKIQFCVSRLGSPILTSAEVVLVRNWSRGIGSPWDRGAGDFLAVYRKLKAAEGKQ